ncbi:LppU/SCO3897 family protein [Streptomyces sp. NBC_01304]|uniref:LppU/SCO3897 family protein n=1 Tax=Streptomyces sp. NBC_01304 TaxID=2903818 RepID=UPI002E129CF9|nr:hypothetical protein OG430_25090 [Streptomyces sp. NBC_01304]
MTTPPPQGQNPYGQPQGGNPYGQQQAPQGYPQQGYPQQPGQPGVPQQPSPYFNQGPAPQPPRSRVSFKTIKNIGIVVVFAIVAIVGYIASQDDADTAAVGDCMHQGSSSSTNPDLEVVDCSDSKAQFEVVGKVSGTYTSDTEASAKCEAEGKKFDTVYSQSGDGEDFLLCLATHKP